MGPYLGQICALGAPHGGCAEAEDDGTRDEGVELGVELGGDVGGVAKHGDDHSPLDGQLLEQVGRHEHARDHQGGVDHGQGERPQAVDLEKRKNKLKRLY